MRRAVRHAHAGHWPPADATGAVTLDFDARHRRRIRLTTDAGEDVLLDLPKAVAMADGDGLGLEDGGWLRVAAAAEPLAEIRAGSAHAMVRVAWHLGNRHLPTEVAGETLRIRPDHVIEAMVQGLGAEVRRIEAPFQPEGGAYAGQGGRHGHHHHHDDDGTEDGDGHHHHHHGHEHGHHH